MLSKDNLDLKVCVEMCRRAEQTLMRSNTMEEPSSSSSGVVHVVKCREKVMRPEQLTQCSDAIEGTTTTDVLLMVKHATSVGEIILQFVSINPKTG